MTTEQQLAVLSERMASVALRVDSKVGKAEYLVEIKAIHDDLKEIKTAQYEQRQDRTQLTRLVVGTLASTLLTLIISIIFLILERGS